MQTRETCMVEPFVRAYKPSVYACFTGFSFLSATPRRNPLEMTSWGAVFELCDKPSYLFVRFNIFLKPDFHPKMPPFLFFFVYFAAPKAPAQRFDFRRAFKPSNHAGLRTSKIQCSCGFAGSRNANPALVRVSAHPSNPEPMRVCATPVFMRV